MSEIVVHWDGNCEGPYSFDIVNRELVTRMHGRYGITIATVPRDGEERSPSPYGIPRISPSDVGRGADIVVRHRWPPRFASSRGAYYIHCQPFEYGTIPVAWREGLRAHADEIWCLSDYVRSTYLAAGFAPEMLTVIPNGYDADVFRIDRSAVAPIQIKARCTFLYIGGALPRKGFDILIDTYLDTFTDQDDVALVMKFTGSRDIYPADITGLAAAIAAIPGKAPVLVSDAELSASQLAALYQSATALLHPYRGEGFGLTGLEASACGTPVVYSAGGAMDEYLHAAIAYPIAAQRVQFTPPPDDTLGPYCSPPWVLDPDRAAFSRIMRTIADHPDTAASLGAQAAREVAAAWTWQHAAEKMAQRFLRIAKKQRAAQRL